MRVTTKLAVTLTFPLLAAFCQAQENRAKYCWEHPNDAGKCKAVPAIDENGRKELLGIPVVCGGDARHSGIEGVLRYEGMNEDLYEKSGLCKLTADEYGICLLGISRVQPAESISALTRTAQKGEFTFP